MLKIVTIIGIAAFLFGFVGMVITGDLESAMNKYTPSGFSSSMMFGFVTVCLSGAFALIRRRRLRLRRIEEERQKRLKEIEEERQKRLKEQMRRLAMKYGEENVQKILNHEIWQGMTKEMLLDSWGNPEDRKMDVHKTKTKEQWFYGKEITRLGTEKYKIVVRIENDTVVGWKEL